MGHPEAHSCGETGKGKPCGEVPENLEAEKFRIICEMVEKLRPTQSVYKALIEEFSRRMSVSALEEARIINELLDGRN